MENVPYLKIWKGDIIKLIYNSGCNCCKVIFKISIHIQYPEPGHWKLIAFQNLKSTVSLFKEVQEKLNLKVQIDFNENE